MHLYYIGSSDLLVLICQRSSGDPEDRVAELFVRNTMEAGTGSVWDLSYDSGQYLCDGRGAGGRSADRPFVRCFYGALLPEEASQGIEAGGGYAGGYSFDRIRFLWLGCDRTVDAADDRSAQW